MIAEIVASIPQHMVMSQKEFGYWSGGFFVLLLLIFLLVGSSRKNAKFIAVLLLLIIYEIVRDLYLIAH